MASLKDHERAVKNIFQLCEFILVGNWAELVKNMHEKHISASENILASNTFVVLVSILKVKNRSLDLSADWETYPLELMPFI